MRKGLLLYLLAWLLLMPVLQAQTPVADSLLTVLRSRTQQDTARVTILLRLAREWRREKSVQSDSLLNVAISLSERLQYPKGVGRALMAKGTLAYTQSDFSRALAYYDKARSFLQKAGDKQGICILLQNEASVYMDDGKHALSLDRLLQAIKLAQEIGDIEQLVEAERYIGYLYNVLGEYDKAIPYQTDALKQAKRINYEFGISGAYNAIGKTYKTSGNYPAALEAYQNGLKIDEQRHDSSNIYISHSNISDVYERMGNYPEALRHIRMSMGYFSRFPRSTMLPWNEWVLAKIHTHAGNADSGMYYGRRSLQRSLNIGWRLYLREITQVIAEAAVQLRQWDTAYKYQVLSSNYKDSLTGEEIARKTAMLQATFELDKKQAEIALLKKDKQLQQEENRRERVLLFALLGGLAAVVVFAVVVVRSNRQKQLANLLLQRQKEETDRKAREVQQQKEQLEQAYGNVELLGEIGRKITSSLSVEKIISTVYDNVNALMDAAVFGIGIYHADSNTIEFPATYERGVALPAYANAVQDENRFASLCFTRGQEIVMGDLSQEYNRYLQQMPVPKQGEQPNSLIYLPLRVKEQNLGVITVQSFQKNAFTDYHLYMLRNIAIYAAIALENAESYEQLQQTVGRLKATQAQLVQSEKMASLGELTAGIAHEIQNPLNFVNNFAEVNRELLGEMLEEIQGGNYEEARSIANSLVENEEKIIYHGKRADGIVKSMLQHSRTSTGEKEATDVNVLCDEYLRLAYHGIRAKDKTFNATMQTSFAEGLPMVKTVPQDLGRVLLNLITNAFYAIDARKKKQPAGYQPTIQLSTREENGKLYISISDNGTGIPEHLKQKIFQPFFTTKPTGEGTGLGLSLSYDIVTKGHGGQLKVDSREGEGTTFTIELPL